MKKSSSKTQNAKSSGHTSMPEGRLDVLVSKNHMVMRKIVQERLREAGREIPAEEIPILGYILFQEGLTQLELGEKTMKNGPNLTRILDRMVKRGLIRKVKDKEDGRKQRIYIKKAGRDVMESFFPVIEDYFKYVTADISLEDMQVTLRTLERVYSRALEMQSAVADQ